MPACPCASIWTDQRGIALPLSLIVLLLLASLTLAFMGLGASEPTIANNLRGGEQALALAEAGMERGLWALANPAVTGLTNPAQIPVPYNNGQLFSLPGNAEGTYAITLALVAAPNTWQITARGYVLRNGVAVPATPGQLASANIAAQRGIQLRANVGPLVGGPGAPLNQNFPGALTAAGKVSMSGSSSTDGNNRAPNTPNTCSNKAGDTVRDNGQDTIDLSGNGRTDGTVPVSYSNDPKLKGSQKLPVDQFNQSLLSTDQLAALKSLAQGYGAYIKPTSNSQINLDVSNGLVFVDTVNGQPLGSPPNPSLLANVKVSGTQTGGWLIVMGDITIDGNVISSGTYRGLVYALNTLTYTGTGGGAIYGAMVAANVTGSTGTVVTMGGNSKVFYDCVGVGTGGGTFSDDFKEELNRAMVSVVAGSWAELESN